MDYAGGNNERGSKAGLFSVDIRYSQINYERYQELYEMDR